MSAANNWRDYIAPPKPEDEIELNVNGRKGFVPAMVAPFVPLIYLGEGNESIVVQVVGEFQTKEEAAKALCNAMLAMPKTLAEKAKELEGIAFESGVSPVAFNRIVRAGKLKELLAESEEHEKEVVARHMRAAVEELAG